jgi:ribosomal protein S18 acetylase RimI-like enzyme
MITEFVNSKKEEVKSFADGLWNEFAMDTGNKLEENDFFFIAKKDSESIGYLNITITDKVANLNNLIIKKEYRNKGYGKEMMGFFMKFSKLMKCHKMRIKTCPERMPAAFHLYQKMGFIVEAVLKNDYFNKDWVILSKFIEI